MSKKMFQQDGKKNPVEKPSLENITGKDIFENQILILVFDIFMLVYSIIYQKVTGFL